MNAATAWILDRVYAKKTAEGAGAIKGNKGDKGDPGTSLDKIEFDSDKHLIVTLTDGTKKDAGAVPDPDLSAYAKSDDVPKKVTDLSDGADYAKKSEIPEGSVVDDALSKTSKNPVQNRVVTAELKDKVDAVDGKGLSTNDYDDAAKAEVAKIKDKVDAVDGKGLSTNDYDNASKDKVDAIPADPKYTDTVYDDTEIKKEISKKIDAVDGKGLSTNDYDTAAKTKVDAIPEDPKYTDTVYDDTEIKKDIAKKVDIQQDVADKGKALIVGADGKVVPAEISTDTSMVEKAIADNWGGNGYNLIPFPYYRKSGYSIKDCTYTYTDEWITIKREDGSVLTEDSYFAFTPVDNTLEEGKYALILDGNIDESIHFRLGVDRRKTDVSHDYINRYVTGNPKSKVALFEYNDKADGVAPQCWICFTHGASAVTATFRAMLVKVNEDGSYPTEYQRYASGNVKLTDAIEKDAVTAKVNNFVNPTSDAEILALSNGIYSINVDDTSLFPSRWGTLIVLKSGYVYGSMIFITTNQEYYFRNINSGAWRETVWQKLATATIEHEITYTTTSGSTKSITVYGK